MAAAVVLAALGTGLSLTTSGDIWLALPALAGIAAAAVWLATNPSQADNGDHVLREGTRLVFKGETPEPLAEWLAARGIEP